jgi:aminoglycoside phosphotransferase (APT) family kinase protein
VGLLRYLSSRLGVQDLRYSSEPTPVSDGWETYIYHFQLQGADTLPPEFRGPLTLRLFAGALGRPRGEHAFAVQRHMHSLGYPAPRPICWEETCDWLGGPFLIMEQIPGPTEFQRMLSWPWIGIAVARRMAVMQTWLHQLPSDHFPCPPEPLLERCLDEIQGLIRQYDMPGLRPGLEWLLAHQPEPPARPRIVHLDIHPLNLIHRDGQPPAVLDWDEADVGDPHADVATTVILIRCAPIEGKNLREQIIISTGRGLLERFYLFACWRRIALDGKKLRYYQALAVLRRLSRCGRWLRDGPQATGAKPSLLRHLRPAHLETLGQHFRHLTGVPVRLEKGLWTMQPREVQERGAARVVADLLAIRQTAPGRDHPR